VNASEPEGRSRAAAIAEGTAAGMMFLAGPLGGFFLGRWAGRVVGGGDLLAWIGGALGLAAAFANFFGLARRISR
jgi:positive regulator of sigma E activity